jgi:hypothetical protein
MRRHKRSVALLAGVLVLGSFGCAARQAHRQGPAAVSLESRVEAYWKRREAKDLAGAYPFYCAGYRQRVSPSEFLALTRLTRLDIRETRVSRIDHAGERTAVTVSYTFIMPMVSSEPIAGDVTESWSREADGSWCKEDEPLVLPFGR